MPLPHNFKYLQVNQLAIYDTKPMVFADFSETLFDFSYRFEFGKSYLLDQELGFGGWAISWALGGRMPLSKTAISIDSVHYEPKQLRKIAWCVELDGYKRKWYFPLQYKSVKHQVEDGLSKTQHTSVAEIMENFLLAPSRYARPLTQQSSEKWRSGLAIAYAHGRSIYCFPHLDFYSKSIIREYGQLWLKDIIQFLTNQGALVIIPAQLDSDTDGFFDVVVPNNLIKNNDFSC